MEMLEKCYFILKQYSGVFQKNSFIILWKVLLYFGDYAYKICSDTVNILLKLFICIIGMQFS